MPHLRDDLGERVVAERGVDIRADGGDEVAQRLAREPAAQIDGDGQRHGAQAVGLFALLLFQNDVNEHSGEVFGDRRAVLFRLLAQLRERHEAHRHMERVKRLACAGILIRRRLAVEAQCVVSCVAGIGVLHLLLARRLVQIKHTVPRRDINAGLAQVFGQQRAEEDDGSAAVGKRVEDLNRNAVAVIVKAHEPAVVFLEAHGLAGVGHVLFQKRPRRAVVLQIVPERTLTDAHGKGREARHAAVDGALKRRGVDVLFHQGGKTVDG